MPMQKNKSLLFATLLVIPMLTLVGCQKDNTPTSTNTNSAASTTNSSAAKNTNASNTVSEEGTSTEKKEFDIEASEFAFTPDTITVKEGDTVVLHITAKDTDHGISIPEFGVSETLKPGETVDVEFVADKTGEFTMSCNVFCGSGHSTMTGTLIVE